MQLQVVRQGLSVTQPAIFEYRQVSAVSNNCRDESSNNQWTNSLLTLLVGRLEYLGTHLNVQGCGIEQLFSSLVIQYSFFCDRGEARNQLFNHFVRPDTSEGLSGEWRGGIAKRRGTAGVHLSSVGDETMAIRPPAVDGRFFIQFQWGAHEPTPSGGRFGFVASPLHLAQLATRKFVTGSGT